MSHTIMETEARAVPNLMAKQLHENVAVLTALCERIHKANPPFAVTIGRGSSDHACTYAKYLIETHLDIVTASAAPSIVTLYKTELKMHNALVIGISQSGKSPDICQTMEMARRNGAITVAIVNTVNSPLAQIAEFVVPLGMGEEKAVAATKSYIASLTAIAQFTALCSGEEKLQRALLQLPEILHQAAECNWDSFIKEFKNIDHTLVIARGYGFPIAQEAALKFKETAVIQAEAFSSAEVLHGPFALIKSGRPYLLLTQNDVSLNEVISLARKIAALGGKALIALPDHLSNHIKMNDNIITLDLPKTADPILDPIAVIQAFYPMVAKLAVARGFNPDAPVNLKKVTETL
jgi:glutamine---fructose-6-phosphate transaminase (isomerizing)